MNLKEAEIKLKEGIPVYLEHTVSKTSDSELAEGYYLYTFMPETRNRDIYSDPFIRHMDCFTEKGGHWCYTHSIGLNLNMALEFIKFNLNRRKLGDGDTYELS